MHGRRLRSIYYESLQLSQHGWPCGRPDGRLSMMKVYYNYNIQRNRGVEGHLW